MKKLFFLILLACYFTSSCQNVSKKPTNMTNDQNPNNPYYSRTDTTTLNVPDATWKKILPNDLYQVARNKATERPFTGKYNEYDGLGMYYCAVCGNALFRSDAKFSSTCGWPSFFQPTRKNSVVYHSDTSYGMSRVEVLCGRCGSHLGHVFDDGPPPTGQRYCMNSISLDFVPDEK
jgi:peptide-methionine (R)-S-oxide reductase